MELAIPIDESRIVDFCRQWKVTEFSLFGSVLGKRFGPDSDVDVLVDFADEAEWSLLDIVEMKEQLERIFGRSVDLLTRRGVEQSPNWIRRRDILEHLECIYAA